jgi:hypothetical protein
MLFVSLEANMILKCFRNIPQLRYAMSYSTRQGHFEFSKLVWSLDVTQIFIFVIIKVNCLLYS